MTLKDFEQLIAVKNEILVLNRRLEREQAKGNKFVADFAKDYSSGFAHAVTLRGYSIADSDKMGRIRTVLENRKDRLEKLVYDAELFIDSISDSKVRMILTLRYIEGEEWNDVAKKVYRKMTGDAARMSIIRFFKNV